ncbi:MAG: hypothetical protein JO332_18810 [Planctomycetaceae bacterium]|nr:hypothetical protein [Planctomycetaceae bacterium]
MGQEIVYCYKCSTRIVGADSGKNAAYSIGDRVACADCASALVDTLPERQREELLSRMLKDPKTKAKAPTRRTPSRGTEAVAASYPAPHRSAPSKTPLALAAVGVAGVVLILVATMSSGSTTKPVDPTPAPAVPEHRPERPSFPPPLPKENFEGELQRIDESIAGVNRQEGFKESLDYLASARKRHDASDWTVAIDRRVKKTQEEIQTLFASLEAKATDARRRGSEAEVKETLDRVGRWNLPDRAAALKKTLDALVLAPFRQGADGILCVEAEHYSAISEASGHAWTKVQQPAGFEGEGAMAGLPNDGGLFLKDYAAKSPRLDYRVEFLKTGPHYVWVRASADSDADNSVHAGLDGDPVPSLAQIAYTPTKKWVWANKQMNGPTATFTVAAAGIHTFNLWVREDGAVIDRFVITSDPKWTPKGNGPAESPR